MWSDDLCVVSTWVDGSFQTQASIDVLDAGGRVGLELSPPLPQ